jgi:hypothetical protein
MRVCRSWKTQLSQQSLGIKLLKYTTWTWKSLSISAAAQDKYKPHHRDQCYMRANSVLVCTAAIKILISSCYTHFYPLILTVSCFTSSLYNIYWAHAHLAHQIYFVQYLYVCAREGIKRATALNSPSSVYCMWVYSSHTDITESVFYSLRGELI